MERDTESDPDLDKHVSGSIRWRSHPMEGAGFRAGRHTWEIWDAASGELIRSIDVNSSGIRAVVFSPEGMRLLSGGAWVIARAYILSKRHALTSGSWDKRIA